MNETLLLYLFTRVDVIHGAAIVLLILGGAALFLWQMIERADTGKFPVIQLWKWVGLSALIAIVLLVPRQKDLAVIIGGAYAIKAARPPEAKEIGGLVFDAIQNVLKERK